MKILTRSTAHIEVAKMVTGSGRTKSDIANALGVSVRTVYRALGVAGKLEVLAMILKELGHDAVVAVAFEEKEVSE